MSLASLQNYHQHHFQGWKDKFEALSLRERVLFLISLIAVLYIAWDMVLMDRLHGQQKTAVVQMKKWQQQIADIDTRIQTVSAQLSGSKWQENRQRIEELKAKIDALKQREKNLVVGFIRPRQMVDVLKGLLAGEKGLQLTSLQSQAAQPLVHKSPIQDTTDPTTGQSALIHGKEVKQPQSESAVAKASGGDSGNGNTANLPEVYQHGLQVVFQGDYHSTLSYLRKLEQLPWKFYWDEVTYEVLQYPKAQISIRIHTLSLEKGWIGV